MGKSDDGRLLSGDELLEFMKPEIIAEFGKSIKTNRRTILTIAGESGLGKTVFCVQSLNSAILKGYKVLYYDGDDQQIINRQVPNLFSIYSSRNPKKYSENFFYGQHFDEEKIFDDIDKIQPKLVIIDNIYNPFLKKYRDSNPMERAKKIKLFCIKFRSIISTNDMSAIITTPAMRISKKLVQLGGEIVKGIANTKYFIDKPPKHEGLGYGGELNSKSKKNIRVFIRDGIQEISFSMDENGEMTEL